jgi:hypothetical protein
MFLTSSRSLDPYPPQLRADLESPFATFPSQPTSCGINLTVVCVFARLDCLTRLERCSSRQDRQTIVFGAFHHLFNAPKLDDRDDLHRWIICDQRKIAVQWCIRFTNSAAHIGQRCVLFGLLGFAQKPPTTDWEDTLKKGLRKSGAPIQMIEAPRESQRFSWTLRGSRSQDRLRWPR